jgi:hypothetical protein
LVAKVSDVVGLYLNPPANAIVLSIDELGRDEARCRLCRRYVSSSRPPNRTCASPRIRLSTSPCRWVMRFLPMILSARAWECSRPGSGSG